MSAATIVKNDPFGFNEIDMTRYNSPKNKGEHERVIRMWEDFERRAHEIDHKRK